MVIHSLDPPAARAMSARATGLRYPGDLFVSDPFSSAVMNGWSLEVSCLVWAYSVGWVKQRGIYQTGLDFLSTLRQSDLCFQCLAGNL